MKEINIAELLKDCPKGMELDCTSYDNVSFDKISDDKRASYPIFCYITDEEGNRSSISFTENGCESKRYGAKCVIFPIGKTTWEGFIPPCNFKDGDIVATTNGLWIGITKGGKNGCLIPTYCALKFDMEFEAYFNEWRFSRFATEEEKQKLFDAIKDNGYRWNAETKTLEKLVKPKFKVGDRVLRDDYVVEITEFDGEEEVYVCESKVGGIECILLSEQDNWELVPSKFDINTLKPFDKVLVRDNDEQLWLADLFGFYRETLYPFMCVGHYTNQCVPYEGNEHLLGTSDECDEYYKNWE